MNRLPSNRAAVTRYNNSEKGRSSHLQDNHGYSKEDADVLARIIYDPYTRCSICGVPARWLDAKRREGWEVKHIVYSLTVDHIDPGGPSTMENTRILCHMCNRLRGARYLTDAQVLYRTRRWYERRKFAAKDLWWLNTSPGRGGKLRLGTNRIHPDAEEES